MKFSVLDLITAPPASQSYQVLSGTRGTRGTAPETQQIACPPTVPPDPKAGDKLPRPVTVCPTDPVTAGQTWDAEDHAKQGLFHLSHVSHQEDASPTNASPEHSDPTTKGRQAEVSRAWAAAYDRLGVDYPEDGRDTLEGLAPELLAEWDEAEDVAEVASRTYIADETRCAAFKTPFAAWDATVVTAVRYITARCHTCLREATVTFVTDYGARTCARCLQEAAAPTAPRTSARTKPPRKPSVPPSRPDLFNRRR